MILSLSTKQVARKTAFFALLVLLLPFVSAEFTSFSVQTDDGVRISPSNIRGVYGETIGLVVNTSQSGILNYEIIGSTGGTALQGSTGIQRGAIIDFTVNGFGTYTAKYELVTGNESFNQNFLFSVVNTPPRIDGIEFSPCAEAEACTVSVFVRDEQCSTAKASTTLLDINGSEIYVQNNIRESSSGSCEFTTNEFRMPVGGEVIVQTTVTDSQGESTTADKPFMIAKTQTISTLSNGTVSCSFDVVTPELVYFSNDFSDEFVVRNRLGVEQTINVSLLPLVGKTAQLGRINTTSITLGAGARESTDIHYVRVSSQEVIRTTEMQLNVSSQYCSESVPVLFKEYRNDVGEPLSAGMLLSGESGFSWWLVLVILGILFLLWLIFFA